MQNVLPTAASACCTLSVAGPQSPANISATRTAAARNKKALDRLGLGTGAVTGQVITESKTSDFSQFRHVPDLAVARQDSSAAPAEASSSVIVRAIGGLLTGRLVKRYKRFLADVQVCLRANSLICMTSLPNQLTGNLLGTFSAS